MPEKKNIKLSFCIALGLHFVFIFLLWGFQPENIGIREKPEEERIQTRLVKLIRPQAEGAAGADTQKNAAEQLKKSEKIKWQQQNTDISFSEKLPDISIPTIERSDRKIPSHELEEKQKPEELTINRTTEKKAVSEDIKIKYSESETDLTEGLDGTDLTVTDKFKEDYNVAGPADSSASQGNKNKGLPGGLQLNDIEGGKGKVYWSKNNKLPQYPAEAEKNGWQGNVKLKLNVSSTGKITQVFIEEKSGYPLLDQAAKIQARSWTIFIIEKQQKISGTVLITIPFILGVRHSTSY